MTYLFEAPDYMQKILPNRGGTQLGSWRLLGWWLLAAPGGSWRLLLVHGGSWRLLMVPGGSWWLWEALDGSWWHLAASSGNWRLLMAPGSPWWLLVAPSGPESSLAQAPAQIFPNPTQAPRAPMPRQKRTSSPLTSHSLSAKTTPHAGGGLGKRWGPSAPRLQQS